MNAENPLPGWARQILIGAAAFVVGGLIAFGYSYRPLHGALSWKVDSLEERLDERNRENLQLSDELARLQTDESERIEPEAFEQIQAELKKTRAALAKAEKAVDRAEQKRKKANSSAATWRKRYETLRDESEPRVAADTSGAGAGPTPAGDSPNEATDHSVPASPDPGTGPGSPQASGRGMLPAEGSATQIAP